MGRLNEVIPVHVRYETKRQTAITVEPECLVGHHWPEVRAADTDVDDVANALAIMALPPATTDPVAKVSHLVEHSVDLRDDVLAVNDHECASRRTQSHVQHGSVLRNIDLLTTKHRVDTC